MDLDLAKVDEAIRLLGFEPADVDELLITTTTAIGDRFVIVKTVSGQTIVRRVEG